MNPKIREMENGIRGREIPTWGRKKKRLIMIEIQEKRQRAPHNIDTIGGHGKCLYCVL